jgi:hypothetical protein
VTKDLLSGLFPNRRNKKLEAA